MKHLKPAQISQIDRDLEQRAAELHREIRRLLLESDQQHYRDLAGIVHDSGDEAVASELADIGAAFIDRHVRELRDVEAARVRLNRGIFGICTDCSADIPWERLAVYPIATRCADCARQHEKGVEHMPTL
jgi:DnaK suppressor protein